MASVQVSFALMFVVLIVWTPNDVAARDDGICDGLLVALKENKLDKKVTELKKCMNHFTDRQSVEKCSAFEKLLSVRNEKDALALCSAGSFPKFEREINACIEKTAATKAQFAKYAGCVK